MNVSQLLNKEATMLATNSTIIAPLDMIFGLISQISWLRLSLLFFIFGLLSSLSQSIFSGSTLNL